MKPFLGIAVLQELCKEQQTRLTALARELDKPLLDSEQGFFNTGTAALALVHTGKRLELRHYGSEKIGAVYTDPHSNDIRRRVSAGRQQPFARALGLHKSNRLRVLDATAGLGRDSLVLAMLGCRVSLLERQPILHALLDDVLRQCSETLHQELQLLPCQEAGLFLGTKSEDFDAIYLDPMYASERRKALPKKEMQLVREICGEDTDADTLLLHAINGARRVVVKRSPHARVLAKRKPSYQLTGNRVRYDVYLQEG